MVVTTHILHDSKFNSSVSLRTAFAHFSLIFYAILLCQSSGECMASSNGTGGEAFFSRRAGLCSLPVSIPLPKCVRIVKGPQGFISLG